jgi:Flp pilus assembly protein CpaB
MRKLNVSVVVGILVALVGAGLVFIYGHNANNKISAGRHPMSVLVADTALNAGTTASDVAGHVHVAQIPAAYVVKGALTSPSALSSSGAQSAVLAGSVPEGGQLSLTDFAQGASAGRVQPAKGNIALSVETPISSGVARYLEPGQSVDVFATYTKSASGQAKTKLFASAVKVLAVSINQASNDSSDSSSASTPDGQVVVLLDLAPKDAEKVVNAVTVGSIYLAYTPNPHDKTSSATTPSTVLTSNK